ncbi:phage capsid protein [Salsuginibacillus kocurii]|uniref:phage capsid protein n=1 Tax=Salsuginibacillus kocurii TaxID=427078 RepID=UPI0003665147|nr:phage capsid protein [Salsuginibacillus kocurii]
MSVNSFIPKVWESRLLHNYKSNSIAGMITTAPTEVTGNTVKFNRIGAVDVNDYDGEVDWSEISTTSVELNLSEKKYFSFVLDDVDAAQSAGELIDDATEEASGSLQEKVDQYVLSHYADAHEDNVIGSDEEAVELTVDNTYDKLVDLGTKLSKKKVPKADRYVVINHDVLGKLSKDERFTRNYEILENGVVDGASVNGMTVVVTEETHVEDGVIKVMALHSSAIGLGEQINEVEAMRLQDKFADGVRGLMVYGAVVKRPEALATLNATVE